jgi:hypothetical protein
MRVTRLLIFLSVLLTGMGLASLVASGALARPTYDRQAREFAESFAPSSGKTYEDLHERATALYEALVDERVGELALTGGAALTIGVLFLCWGLDRARLLARIRRMSKP